VNAPAVEAVLTSLSIPIQLGGGIRDHAAIDLWIEKGVARVILGTVALRDPDLVRTACRRHPGRIAVGIDARGGRVAVEGWAEQSEVAVLDLARRFEDAGVARIVYTNIERDGALRGVDIEGTVALAQAISIPVIASGGVSSLADLRALKQASCPNIEGVISGRALYDGRISPKAALDLLAA
jgi:phosphoribosylformimino-5-aminoimidazole carboxamide ribotide isomerase